MSWHCIPILKGVACGAVAVAALAAVHPIAHFQAFMQQHPIPACQQTAVSCHMIWTPDSPTADQASPPGDQSGPGYPSPADDDSQYPYGFVPGSSYSPNHPVVSLTTVLAPPVLTVATNTTPPPSCCVTTLTTLPPINTVTEPATFWLFVLAGLFCLSIKHHWWQGVWHGFRIRRNR